MQRNDKLSRPGAHYRFEPPVRAASSRSPLRILEKENQAERMFDEGEFVLFSEEDGYLFLGAPIDGGEEYYFLVPTLEDVLVNALPVKR